MKKYRCGVIGLGNIGMLYEFDFKTLRNYQYPSHTICYANNPRTELLAGCDIDKEKLELFKKKYPQSLVYDDYNKMLSEQNLDVISICAPTDQHIKIVNAALKSNVRLIFCEKPLGTNAKDAFDLLKQCDEKNISLIVNYWRRFDQSHREINQLISNNIIGSLQHIRCIYGNGLLNNASHIINLLLWLAGPIEWVISVDGISDRNNDQNNDFIIRFRSGTNATISSVSFDKYRLIEMDLIGEKGRIIISNEGQEINIYNVQPNEDVSGSYQLNPNPRNIKSSVGMALYNTINEIVNIIDSNNKIISYDAVETLLVLDAIKLSSQKREKKIFIKSINDFK